MPPYLRILVPVDGSEPSNKALAAALQIARDSGGRVRLLHCVDELAATLGDEPQGHLHQRLRQQGEQVLHDAAEVARSSGVANDTHLVDRPAQRLGQSVADEATGWHADLVVTGTHGRRGIDRLLLGSGAEQIVRLAPTPVLVVRGDHAGHARD